MKCQDSALVRYLELFIWVYKMKGHAGAQPVTDVRGDNKCPWHPTNYRMCPEIHPISTEK